MDRLICAKASLGKCKLQNLHGEQMDVHCIMLSTFLYVEKFHNVFWRKRLNDLGCENIQDYLPPLPSHCKAALSPTLWIAKNAKDQGSSGPHSMGVLILQMDGSMRCPCKAVGPDALHASFLCPSCPEFLVLYIPCIQCCILFSPQLGLATFPHVFKNTL